MRRQSAEALLDLDFEGYAVGGLAVGEPKSEMYDTVEFTADLLPRDRPRYLMGVGTPEDLLEGVARGIDMFDCVMPTRNARNACAFTSEGKVIIKNARYARDDGASGPGLHLRRVPALFAPLPSPPFCDRRNAGADPGHASQSPLLP